MLVFLSISARISRRNWLTSPSAVFLTLFFLKPTLISFFSAWYFDISARMFSNSSSEILSSAKAFLDSFFQAINFWLANRNSFFVFRHFPRNLFSSFAGDNTHNSTNKTKAAKWCGERQTNTRKSCSNSRTAETKRKSSCWCAGSRQ